MRDVHIDGIRNEFLDRINSIKDLINSTHPSNFSGTQQENFVPLDVQKSIRGLVIVMLFGTYERLLHSLCRELIETAASFKGNQKRLSNHFKMIGLFSIVRSVQNNTLKKKTLWKTIMPKLACADGTPASKLDQNIWPDNGEYMRQSQLKLFCEIFHLESGRSALGRVNTHIDSIVHARNQIAHGELTALEVGRNYSVSDLRQLVKDWQNGWCNFLDEVEQITRDRQYFIPR